MFSKARRRVARWLVSWFTSEERAMRDFAIGMNSTVASDAHIIFLDYDTKSLELVATDVRELIEHFRLGAAEVFETRNGFHVFFWFDHVPYSRLRLIIEYSRCDPLYKHISKYYDHKTIRAAGKYQSLDIEYRCGMRGKRSPTLEEREVGRMKRDEYFALRKMHGMLNPGRLKE